jgi:hypothetical protein
MRFIATALLCAGVLVTAAGCDPTDKHFFTQGVGTRLTSDDIAAEKNKTDLQDAYIAEICRQAGLQPATNDSDVTTCGGADPRTTWTLFVQAGMNDIDQRCDAYLTWLDEFKRSRDPILNQITQTGTTTGNILLAAGAHQVPITIVANAFGLAGQTFTNISSRLILELPHSTVQAVVLGKQNDYRNEVFGIPGHPADIVIASRPAAIYVLRSYLRLCMPMTIETEVNNTATTVARGGPDALMTSSPLISPSNVGKTVGPAKVIRLVPVTDDAGVALTKYVYPNGELKQRDRDHAKQVLAYIAQNSLGVSLTTFLHSPDLTDHRVTLARQLKLIQ